MGWTRLYDLGGQLVVSMWFAIQERDSGQMMQTISCVCGEEFDAPDDLPGYEHIHCPACGSYYDAGLQFQISKKQTAILRAHKDEWAPLSVEEQSYEIRI